jgi:tRNA A37 threonylcarbamoyltransferase TsaD
VGTNTLDSAKSSLHFGGVEPEEQIECFAHELDRLVDRYCDEFNLSYAEVVGVMHFKTHLLMRDWHESEDHKMDKPNG